MQLHKITSMNTDQGLIYKSHIYTPRFNFTSTISCSVLIVQDFGLKFQLLSCFKNNFETRKQDIGQNKQSDFPPQILDQNLWLGVWGNSWKNRLVHDCYASVNITSPLYNDEKSETRILLKEERRYIRVPSKLKFLEGHSNQITILVTD